MTIQPAEPHVTRLLSYVIASADMYYTEMEVRDVFLSSSEQGGFRIWGKMAHGDASTAIDLFQIFLEYALHCCSLAGIEEPLLNMQDFGERLGRSLAKQLKSNTLPCISDNPAVRILKYIFETIDAHPSVENTDAGVRVAIPAYSLEKAAQCSGLCHIELAHCGINSMCASLIHGINPDLVLRASTEARCEFVFTIMSPSFA